MRRTRGQDVGGVTTSFSDITRRKEAEASVHDQREQLQDFLENAGDLILIANRRRPAAVRQPRLARRAGVHRRRAHHRPPGVGVPRRGAAAGATHDEQRRLFLGESLREVETTFVGPTGRRVSVLGSTTCRFEHGIPVATRSIFRDMTEVNAAHEQLMMAIEQGRRREPRQERVPWPT